jgi:hypothetical protein
MRCKLLIIGSRNRQFRLISEYFHSLVPYGAKPQGCGGRDCSRQSCGISSIPGGQCRYCIRPWMACSRAMQEQLPTTARTQEVEQCRSNCRGANICPCSRPRTEGWLDTNGINPLPFVLTLRLRLRSGLKALSKDLFSASSGTALQQNLLNPTGRYLIKSARLCCGDLLADRQHSCNRC